MTLNFSSIPKLSSFSPTKLNPLDYYVSLIDKLTHYRPLTQTQTHTQLIDYGLHHSGFLITKLINATSNVGKFHYARKVFDSFTHPDVFLCNVIIRGYSRHGFFRRAVEMYSTLQFSSVCPDEFTLPHVLKACAELFDIEKGRRVHGQIFRLGFESHVVVQNSLVAFYAKCGQIDRARVVFDLLNDRTVVTWTSMLSGILKPMEALRIFREMRE